MEEKVTVKQLNLMKHTLGLGRGKKFKDSYRNYFCASPGSDDTAQFEQLVLYGLANLYKKPTDMLPYNTYVISEKGKEFIKNLC